MATAIATKSSATGTAGDVTVTKPTSLAVGDIMIAFIHSSTSGAGGETHTGPSGWTKLENVVVSNGSILTVWGVVATSTQTAASNFSWTSAGTNDSTIGTIFRITGTNGFQSLSDNVVSTSNSALTNGGVTTLSTNTLLLLAGTDESVDTDVEFSAYAVTNNDPTWTEEYDLFYDTGSAANIGIASADYPYIQATGTATVTTNEGSDEASALVAITENIDVTASPAVIDLTSSVQAPSVTGDANISPAVIDITATPQAPTITTEDAKWSNKAKSSTSWNNKNKS